MQENTQIMNVVSRSNIMFCEEEKFFLCQSQYIFQPAGKLIRDIVGEPLLELCDLQPDDPNEDVALACAMSYPGFKLVPEMNLQYRNKSKSNTNKISFPF